ncbi:hypothetical protein [Pseudomonas fluorescens]|uniref:hypothetical protein n=1 Tax=Pseudomonas fluorescens TaxID=294 RepID=UPI000F473C2B|nr:hypothetical protein [Pseudomonas fluorescens]RON82196.1 hypothetical protein BK668_27085 [Pseudomonas fluorescens]
MASNKVLLLALWLFNNLAVAATGPEVASLLNTRYQNTTAECVGDHPAYFCSGVLVRGSPESGEFWQHDATSTELGAESFSYLRADLGTRALAQKSGVVFSDSFTAIGQGKALEVLCAYPFAFAMTGTRPAFGCGSNSTKGAEPDPSSCAAHGVTDALSWMTHFQQQGLQPDKQCSLSSHAPPLFKASLIAHEGFDATWAARPNLLQIKNWDAAAPKQMPIQALFYDVTQTGALLGAQKDQRDYFNATGDWLPILRLGLKQRSGGVFGFNLQDQLYIGYQVAARMNARYQDVAASCANEKPAYYCNGVLIRGADASAGFHAWNPSPNSITRNGVSFSYVREDVGTLKLAGNQGYTFKESYAPTGHPATLRCSYPANASTSAIPDSCRASCESQNITTVETWRAKHAANPSGSCAFSSTPAAFQLSIAVRTVMTAAARQNWNEIIIAAWPQNIPEQIPLESLFYLSGDNAALNNAKFIQRDYFQQTARYLPIVRMNLGATDHRPFIYETADQTVQGTSTQTLINGITPRAPGE